MCAVSFVGDHYNDRFKDDPFWKETNPWIRPWPQTAGGGTAVFPSPTLVTQDELDQFKREMGEKFDEMKREIESMKDLLLRAKKYDDETGQPDCEIEDKVAMLKRMAQLFGVDLSEVFGGTK